MGRLARPDVGYFLLGGFDLLGEFVQTFTFDELEALEDISGSGDKNETWADVGIEGWKGAQTGIFNDTVGKSHDALDASVGVSQVLMVSFAANAIGNNFQGFAGAIVTVYQRRMAVGAFHKANATYQGSGKSEKGKTLHAHGAETADSGNTDGTSVDNTAASTNGGAGYLEVSALALGGSINVPIWIRDSADDISFADHSDGAFAVVTTAPSAQRIILTGTIRRYAAMRWDFEGVPSGNSIIFAVGLVRD